MQAHIRKIQDARLSSDRLKWAVAGRTLSYSQRSSLMLLHTGTHTLQHVSTSKQHAHEKEWGVVLSNKTVISV